MIVVCVGSTEPYRESLGSEPGSSCVFWKKSNEQHFWGRVGDSKGLSASEATISATTFSVGLMNRVIPPPLPVWGWIPGDFKITTSDTHYCSDPWRERMLKFAYQRLWRWVCRTASLFCMFAFIVLYTPTCTCKWVIIIARMNSTRSMNSISINSFFLLWILYISSMDILEWDDPENGSSHFSLRGPRRASQRAKQREPWSVSCLEAMAHGKPHGLTLTKRWLSMGPPAFRCRKKVAYHGLHMVLCKDNVM